MTKHRWKGTMKSLGNHLDPEKDEQLKWVKIGKTSTREHHESLQLYRRMWDSALKPKNMQFKSRVPAQNCYPERGFFWYTEWQLIRKISNKVKRILKLAKNMNPGSKDGNLKKRAELINLVEDFHQQYESLDSLYGDLKVQVKRNVKGGDDDASSTSTSDSETFYSPGGSNVVSSNVSKASESETSDFEDTILKDKLTSTSEVKKSVNLDSQSSSNKSPDIREIVEDLRIQGGDSEEKRRRLSEIKDLEKQIASLKLENVTVFTQKKQMEEEVERKANESKQMKEKVSKLEAQIMEIKAKSQENERRFSSLRKEFEVKEPQYLSRISEHEAKAASLNLEVDNLQLQKSELEEKLTRETKERVEFLKQELVSVKSNKAEYELELKRKSEETSECLLQIETLRTQLTSQTLNTQHITKEKECTELRVKDLELEIQSLNSNKRDLEEQIKKTKNEAFQSNSEKKKLHDQVKVLESKVENLQNERKSLRVELDSLQNEKIGLETKLEKEKLDASNTKSQMEKKNTELTNKIADKQKTMLELGDDMNKLKDEKGQVQVKFADSKSNAQFMERKLTRETKERVEFLKQELVSVKSNKAEYELELKRKSEETSECLLQIETLRTQLTSQTLNTQHITKEKEHTEVRVKDLELEVQSLNSNKRDLEELIKKTKSEAFQSDSEKKKLHDQVKVLEEKVETLKNERKTLQVELDSLQNEKTGLETKLEKEKLEASNTKSQMEKKNTELTNKIADQQKTMLELGDDMNKLKDEKGQVQVKFADSKSNAQFMERKIEELAEEFRKQFEDKYRILSRRIRVAEQLHVENKEWYIKTKESYELQNKELKQTVDSSKLGFENVKDIKLAANDVLTSLDSVSLKFEECSGNFLNRISKASCELKFAKDWAMRKNKALLHVKDDLDCLLRQLDDKEAEILVYREKVWKSENKVRELEKMIKEKEDGMLGLEEEKREAIRQLCVWIDYHRSRSDYYKKMMSEMNPGRRKA